MRWLFRIFLTLAFLGLATLAILPHAETIRQEWRHIRTTWQIVRAGETTEKAQPIAAVGQPDRSRAILAPSVEGAPPATIEAAAGDPFLAEARQRAREDPEAAMQWLQSEATGAERLRGMLEVVALWAAGDSENALLWLESNAQGLARLETLNSGMELWSQQDPNAAAAWIEGMANDGSKLTAAKALATNWASHNAGEASQWIDQLPVGNLRDETASALVTSWAVTDPEAAANWALSQAGLNGNGDLLNISIREYTKAAPEAAEQYLRSLNETYEAPEAIETYIRTRAQDAPSEAMDWLAQLPLEDPLNEPGNSEIIMQEWSRTDSVAASAWLSKQADGPERDAAIAGFATTMLTFEPGVVAAWANTVSDPKVRLQLLDQSIANWAKTAPVEALDWIKAADIEPSLRKTLASEIGAD